MPRQSARTTQYVNHVGIECAESGRGAGLRGYPTAALNGRTAAAASVRGFTGRWRRLPAARTNKTRRWRAL